MTRAERVRQFEAEEIAGARETEACIGLCDRIQTRTTTTDSPETHMTKPEPGTATT